MDSLDALLLVRQYSETQISNNPDETLYRSLADIVQWEGQQEARGERVLSESANESVQMYSNRERFGASKYYKVFNGVGEVEEISQELEKSWSRVLKHLTKKKRHLFVREEYEKPSMQQLRQMLDDSSKEMEKRRNTKSGKAKSWIVKVLDSIGQYEYLFAMLPKEEKYASMFVGAFTASVKAAQTRESTAERISDCLSRASDQVRALYKSTKAAPDSDYIKRHVACYYCALFKLLAKLLDEWYGSPTHRLRSILGDSLQADIRNSMDKLNYHTEQAEKEANSVANKRWLKIVALRLGAQCQAGLVGTAIDSPRPKRANSPPAPAPLLAGRPSRLQIEPYPSSRNSSDGQASQHTQSEIEDKSSEQDELGDPKDSKPYWSAGTVKEVMERFGQHVQTEKIKNLSIRSRYLSVNRNIYHTLVSWASSGLSGALWVAGPSPDDQPSRNTLTATFVVAALRNLGVPVASYFCAYDPSRYRSFDLEEELLKMVYALIHQVTAFLPDLDSDAHPDDIVDLSTERIGRLNDQKESLAEAIELLADLLSVAPPLLYVIVDGLQVLDKASNSPNLKGCLRRLVDVFKNAVHASSDRAKIVKVGWFTDHQSLTLQEACRSGSLRKEVFDFEQEDELMGMIKVPDVTEFVNPQ